MTMNDVLFSMQFPLGRELMTTVRLVTGGICSLAGFDLDSSEDCKVCVTESLLLLLHGGCCSARVEFLRGERLRVVLTGEGGRTEREERTVEEEISAALLGALVDDLSMTREGSEQTIAFTFGAL